MDVRVKTDKEWLLHVKEHSNRYNVDTNYSDVPIKPQRAIKEILDASDDSIIVNDARNTYYMGHSSNISKNTISLLFSGGFGPMGYGIPGAIGAAFANPIKILWLLLVMETFR